MIVTAYYPDLFQLSCFVFPYLIIAFEVMVAPPFILAIFGFRGSTRAALIGMAIGTLVAWALIKWLQPVVGMGIGFVSMLANGLAMMAAHYLLPQPTRKGVGWQ